MSGLADPILPDPILHRGTLQDALVDRLRDLIVEGTLAPGAKVVEQTLCEQFQVSRTPLRQALRTLEAEGLVVLTPRRGASVAPLSRGDLEEVFPLLGALEAVAGELACQKITPAQVTRARVLHNELVKGYEAADLSGYVAANEAIHALIVDVAMNPTLAKLMRTLNAKVRRARSAANISAERWAEAVAEHEAIIAALEARDGPRLAAVLRNHLANKLAALLDRLDAA